MTHAIRLGDLISYPGTIWEGRIVCIDRRPDGTDFIIKWNDVERWGSAPFRFSTDAIAGRNLNGIWELKIER